MPADILDFLSSLLTPAWAPPFRGQIHEYAGKLVLGRGYAVPGPLDMSTLPHLIEPLEALRDPNVRLESVLGAVQTTKSLLNDIFAPYVVEHDPGDLLWLLEDDPKAKIYAERALELLKSVPEIAAMLVDVDRHKKTNTQILFKNMKLQICGLNPGNVQSLSWPYVIIDEAWLHAWDGLVRQAIDRTTQFPDTHKVVITSQGGWEDDDHHTIHKTTDQRELHYFCPHCGWIQPFELNRERMPIDGKIVKPEIRYSGLSWNTNDTTKPNGRWNYEAAAATTHHVCYRCAGRIEDRPEMRAQLGKTYRYYPAAVDPNALANPLMRIPFPSRVGFHWPREASIRLKWSDQVPVYLSAKSQADEQGYMLPLQEYIQRHRGWPWSDAMAQEQRIIIQEPYDVKLAWPEERYRPLIVDCQRDLKRFYFHVYAVAETGEARMLDRGSLDSFEAIAAKQKEWGIRDQQVFLDIGYEMTKVLRECVKHGHVQTLKKGRKVWACWYGLKGSGQEIFKHERKVKKTIITDWRIFSKENWYDVNIGSTSSGRYPRAPWYLFSALHCADLIRARRDGDANCPKLRVLPDTLPNADPWSYHQQMRSEVRREKYANGRKITLYELVKSGRPNHDWDISKMLMCFMALVGIIGAQAEPEAEG